MTVSQRCAAVFLDRDGVINHDPVGPIFITKPEEFELLPDAARAIRMFNDADLPVVVVTNQEAIARGLITEEGLHAIHTTMCRQIADLAGARIDAIYYCPFHPEGIVPEYTCDSELRKPGAGMLIQAANDHYLDLSSSFFVGDKLTDIQAGVQASCRTVLVLTGPETPDPRTCEPKPDQVAADLLDAARWILSQVESVK